MTGDIPVSREVSQIRDLPDPFPAAISKYISKDKPLKMLIYKPAEKAGPELSSPKVLALTSQSFVFADDVGDGRVNTLQSRPKDVLLLEMANLLLYGHLKVDFAADNRRSSFVMEYNAAAHESYRRAGAMILGDNPGPESGPAGISAEMLSWPDTVRRAAEFTMLPGSQVRSATWWGSVRSGFATELAPAGIVFTRDGRLTIVTLEQSGPWNRVRSDMTTGIIATYLPARHIVRCDIHATPQVAIIDLEMHAHYAGEKFQVLVPNGCLESVRGVVEQAIEQSRQS